MTDLYLHIGTAKTGTTAIQVFLYKNKKVLNKKSCSFPDFKYRFNKVRTQRNAHFLSVNVKDDDLKKDCYNRILKDAKKYSKIILTDEELWNSRAGSREFWEGFKKNLNDNNINLKVIVYLRRQDTYIASHWAQKIKGVRMESYSFQEFLEKSADTNITLDYYSRISLISSIVGKENIIVRPYEFSQFKDNSIIADFMDVIDVDFDEDFVVDDTLRNISLEGNILEVKRYLNKITLFRRNNSFYQNCLLKVQVRLKEEGKFRNCSTFTKGTRQEFMKKYNKGNSAIAKEFLGRDNGILFKTPLPENDPEKCDYSIKELKMILDMINEENRWNFSSPLNEEEFKRISDRAYQLILQDKSKYRIFVRKVKSKIKSIIRK